MNGMFIYCINLSEIIVAPVWIEEDKLKTVEFYNDQITITVKE